MEFLIPSFIPTHTHSGHWGTAGPPQCPFLHKLVFGGGGLGNRETDDVGTNVPLAYGDHRIGFSSEESLSRFGM